MKVQALRNGVRVGPHELQIPCTDGGFVQGTTVAEQLRTFGGRLFRLDDHLDRLFAGLETVGIALPWSRETIAEWANALASDNHALLQPGNDLALVIFVTPGPYGAFAASPGAVAPGDSGPLLGMHTYALPFRNWASLYDVGQPLAIPSIREVPSACWPAALKCRSRMHYHLADREARRIDPEARALLLDLEGHVAEASTASVFLYFEGEGFVAPPEAEVLPSISLRTIRQAATARSIPFVHRTIEAAELFDADEVLLCSTSPCVLAATRIDGRPVGDGRPGRMWRHLIAAWNETAGFDLIDQARRFA
ncbi:MAG TPA: aminotransferase class IV [Pirellulaceae bacterium]|nr:aminotransferase class IV [Pirellulaceae bacterium]